MIRVKKGEKVGLCEPFQLPELEKAGWQEFTEASAPVATAPANTDKDKAPAGGKTGSTPPPAK